MSACDDFIQKLSERLPDMATTKDLINAGLYRSDQGAAAARKSKNGPEFFKLNNKVILYPKQGVLEFLKRAKAV